MSEHTPGTTVAAQWAQNPPEQVRVGDRLQLVLPREALPREILDQAAEFKPLPGDGNQGGQSDASLFDRGWYLDGAPQWTDRGLQFTVVPLRTGEHTLPSLDILVGNKSVGQINPFPLTIASTGTPQEKPPQFLPPVKLRFPWAPLTAGGFLLLALLAVAVYLLVRWSRRKQASLPTLPPPPPKPEDEVALAALAALAQKELWRQRQFKPHYFGVSEPLKIYLGARYGFEAPELTTQELLDEFRKISPSQLTDEVQALFERLDRVKFTDHIPPAEEAMQVLEQTRQLVIKTRRVPSP